MVNCKWCKDTGLYYPLIGEPIACDQCSSISGSNFLILTVSRHHLILDDKLVDTNFKLPRPETETFRITNLDTVKFLGSKYNQSKRIYGVPKNNGSYYVLWIDYHGCIVEFPLFEFANCPFKIGHVIHIHSRKEIYCV